MSDALNATGRPILFSMCEWGVSSPWEYGDLVMHLRPCRTTLHNILNNGNKCRLWHMANPVDVADFTGLQGMWVGLTNGQGFMSGD